MVKWQDVARFFAFVVGGVLVSFFVRLFCLVGGVFCVFLLSRDEGSWYGRCLQRSFASMANIVHGALALLV